MFGHATTLLTFADRRSRLTREFALQQPPVEERSRIFAASAPRAHSPTAPEHSTLGADDQHDGIEDAFRKRLGELMADDAWTLPWSSLRNRLGSLRTAPDLAAIAVTILQSTSGISLKPGRRSVDVGTVTYTPRHR